MKIVFLHLLLLLMFPGKRELFIFYNQAGTKLKEQQLTELKKDQDGVQERDIAIHIVEMNTATAKLKKYGVESSKPFTILLIGKDGGEKLRSDTVVSNKSLFATIDAMPMRKTEIRNK